MSLFCESKTYYFATTGNMRTCVDGVLGEYWYRVEKKVCEGADDS